MTKEVEKLPWKYEWLYDRMPTSVVTEVERRLNGFEKKDWLGGKLTREAIVEVLDMRGPSTVQRLYPEIFVEDVVGNYNPFAAFCDALVDEGVLTKKEDPLLKIFGLP